ncbi:Bug family tripartite tricarboxylate transporter substrate binding protein [Ramlibacter sp.]|uniref:Bug family tripartite tricarboxylate transporter substrate binding protein n=1 Tax=Ramlibacter sp. TaxID=1917967 RepID=UPI003D0BBF95
MDRKQFLSTAVALGAGAALSPMAAFAQAGRYPQKVVRIVVPYLAGGNLDVTTRLFAQHLTEELGQPFVVENRPGANGNTGTEQVARMAADGYSLVMVSAGTLTINPALYRNMPFDPEKDLTHISIVSTGPMVLQVNPNLPAKTVQELVELAKSQPGKLNFGSGGNGTLAHLSLEMLKARTGANIVHVAYKGTSLATTDVMAGHIHGMFDTLSTATPLIKDGKVRALAVTSAKRSAAFPNVPTIAEAGVRDYVAETWAGLVGPAGLPRDVVERLQTAIAKIAARPDVQQKLAAGGSEAVGNTPEQFRQTLVKERASWGEIVKISGARAD